MKNVILFISIFLLSAHTNAQVSVGPAVQGYFTDYIWKTSSPDEHKVPNFGVGALSDITLKGKWHLQPGLFYTTNSYYIADHHISYPSVRVNLNALEIPVNITYKTNQKNNNHFIFSAGPFLAINLGGQQIIHAVDWLGEPVGVFKNSLVIGADTPASFRRIGAGIGLNAGYELKGGFSVRLHYHRGIKNLVPAPMAATYYVSSQNAGITLAYMFGLKHKKHTEKKEAGKPKQNNLKAIRSENPRG